MRSLRVNEKTVTSSAGRDNWYPTTSKERGETGVIEPLASRFHLGFRNPSLIFDAQRTARKIYPGELTDESLFRETFPETVAPRGSRRFGDHRRKRSIRTRVNAIERVSFLVSSRIGSLVLRALIARSSTPNEATASGKVSLSRSPRDSFPNARRYLSRATV